MDDVGFTGTQVGCTRSQLHTLLAIITKLAPARFHHGDCLGADEQAATMARGLGAVIIGYPPELDYKRAWFESEITRQPKPYLERNHDIVDACDTLIATPGQADETQRSGTWATVRYARKKGKPIIIIYPDGNFVREKSNG